MRFYPLVPRILFILFLVHLVFNLEKLIFINEIFSLIGLAYFFTKLTFNHYMDRVSFYIILIFVVFLMYAVFSFVYFSEASAYQFFRTTVFIYSIPAFFLGAYFVKSGVLNLFIISKRFNFYFASIFAIAFQYGGRMANSVALSLLVQNAKKAKLLLFIFLCLFVFVKGGGTSWMFLASYITLLFLVKIDFFGKNARNVFSSFWFIFFLSFTFFMSIGFIHDYVIESTGSAVDGNSIWRLKFWTYLVDYVGQHSSVFGLGFGTPIFDITNPEASFIVSANPNDPNLAYTIGPHNSYLYVFARTGILGSILFIIPHWILFKKIVKRQLYKNNSVFFASFAMLLFIDMAMFNVVLESSMLSGLYWIVFGMLNQYISSFNVYSKAISV